MARSVGRSMLSIITIAQGDYKNYLPEFIESFSFGFRNHNEIKFIVLHNNISWMERFELEKIINTQKKNYNNSIYIEYFDYQYFNWTLSTLMRFHAFKSVKPYWQGSDYVFFADADMKCLETLGPEILPTDEKPYVGVEHPGYYEIKYIDAFEDRAKSTAQMPVGQVEAYFQGCFFGAKPTEFAAMTDKIIENIDKDFKNNIIAIWHDESHLNKYFADNEGLINILKPTYAHPEVYDLKGISVSPTYPKLLKTNKPMILHRYKG